MVADRNDRHVFLTVGSSGFSDCRGQGRKHLRGPSSFQFSIIS